MASIPSPSPPITIRLSPSRLLLPQELLSRAKYDPMMATGGGQGAPHQVTCLGLNVCVANPIPRALSALCCRARNVKHFPLVPREIVYNTLLAFPTLNNVRGGRLGILPASPTVCCTGILSRPISSCGFYPTACGSSNCEQMP